MKYRINWPRLIFAFLFALMISIFSVPAYADNFGYCQLNTGSEDKLYYISTPVFNWSAKMRELGDIGADTPSYDAISDKLDSKLQALNTKQSGVATESRFYCSVFSSQEEAQNNLTATGEKYFKVFTRAHSIILDMRIEGRRSDTTGYTSNKSRSYITTSASSRNIPTKGIIHSTARSPGGADGAIQCLSYSVEGITGFITNGCSFSVAYAFCIADPVQGSVAAHFLCGRNGKYDQGAGTVQSQGRDGMIIVNPPGHVKVFACRQPAIVANVREISKGIYVFDCH